MKKALAALICIIFTLISSAEAPERVAVLFSSYAQMWTEAGGAVSITVGESIERGFCAEGTPVVDSGAGKSINTELLLSFQPDLVICSADIPAQVKTAEVMKAAGISCLTLTVESFEDYKAAFGIMTGLTGNEEAYAEYVQSAEDRINDIVAACGSEGETYAFIRTGASDSSAKLKQSEEHFACDMLNTMGLYNIADGGIVASGSVNVEALLSAAPDWIFISLMGDEKAAGEFARRMLSAPEWQYLDAVRNGHVVILPKDLFHYKPNSRWAEAYEYLFETLSGTSK